MAEEQKPLFEMAPHPAQAAYSAPRPCRDPGPYFDCYYTPADQRRYLRLTCNRPHGHVGPHSHDVDDGGVLCEWDRASRPLYPEKTGDPISDGI